MAAERPSVVATRLEPYRGSDPVVSGMDASGDPGVGHTAPCITGCGNIHRWQGVFVGFPSNPRDVSEVMAESGSVTLLRGFGVGMAYKCLRFMAG